MVDKTCTEKAPKGTTSEGEPCYVKGPHSVHYAQRDKGGGRTRWGKAEHEHTVDLGCAHVVHDGLLPSCARCNPPPAKS